VSTPSSSGGISGTAGVTLNDWVTVDVRVTPHADGAIVCDLTCNGREIAVTFDASGEVDMDVKEPAPG
jgi:hypothetical protein